MGDRRDRDEFEREYAANTRVTGVGADVALHMACPGCGAAGWSVWPVGASVSEAKRCRACGRTFAFLVARSRNGTRLVSELVQVDGPDLPPWYTPTPRRVSRDATDEIARLRHSEPE